MRQILRDQAAGGGFDYFPEGQQADMTAAGIQALRAAGYSCRTKAVRRALIALDRFRSGDGYVLGIGQKAERAVDRLGDPGASSPAAAPSPARCAWLQARQTADGSVRYGPYEVGRIWVTDQALPALARSGTGRSADAPDSQSSSATPQTPIARNFARRRAAAVAHRLGLDLGEGGRGSPRRAGAPRGRGRGARRPDGSGHDRVDHAQVEAGARRRPERVRRLARLLRRPSTGSPRSPPARSRCRSRSPASARGRRPRSRARRRSRPRRSPSTPPAP